MYTLFSILIIIAAVLMILSVLVQNSKGGGLAANFSGANQIVGVRQTADFIEKFTWYLAVAIVVLSLSATIAIPRDNFKKADGLEQKIVNQPTQSVPAFPSSGANKQQPAQEQPAKK